MPALPGNAQFAKRIDEMVVRANHMTPVFESMVVSFHQIENAKFEAEGPGWAPLTSNTVNRKIEEGAHNGILVRSGDLWESLIGVGAFNETVITDEGWESGTTLGYAKFHETGTSGGGPSHHENMPARPPVNLTPEVVAIFFEMMDAWIAGGNANKFPGQSRIAGAI